MGESDGKSGPTAGFAFDVAKTAHRLGVGSDEEEAEPEVPGLARPGVVGPEEGLMASAEEAPQLDKMVAPMEAANLEAK